MSKICKNVFWTLSAFASLIGISVGITSSAIGLKTCARTTGIKKYKSVIKKTEEGMKKGYC